MSDLTASLRRLFDAIVTEAEHNPAFAARLQQALVSISAPLASAAPVPPPAAASAAPRPAAAPKKRAGRRAAGVLDPFAVDQEGQGVLRARLAALSLEELKDIVAEHGMDPSKLAMKWKKPERLVDLIATTVSDRLHKGDAFR
ncbi:MAG TPA: hypothetical protein VF665_05640 [Longimicrobium sp.]|jgi:hypothetical protein|uniref:hypothetical protein n=1 Tax=Longimicrobium sp. TaxID=2029185 RepID=UPI002ED991D8